MSGSAGRACGLRESVWQDGQVSGPSFAVSLVGMLVRSWISSVRGWYRLDRILDGISRALPVILRAPAGRELRVSRFDNAVAQLDAANAKDPNVLVVDGVSRPAALVYAERMTAQLSDFAPGAPEALRLAARAQHLRRWTVPRASYPDGRAGYLRWRADLKRKHGEWAAEILREAGYDAAFCDQVSALIRKERLASCAEAQTLEDVVCLVFLHHYADAFFSKHDDEKAIGILKKTWVKMSGAGQARARQLLLSVRVRNLLDRALTEETQPGAGSA